MNVMPLDPAHDCELSPQAVDDLLAGILASPRAVSRRSRSKRLLAGGIGSLVLIGGAAAAAVTLGSSPKAQVQTYCFVPGNGSSDVIGPTGDPVENCRIAWPHLPGGSAQVPELKAYQDSAGAVEVHPASESPRAGLRPLVSGDAQDPVLISLSEAFNDQVDGFGVRCFNETGARAEVRHILDAQHQTGWPIKVLQRRVYLGPGDQLCWGAAPQGDHTIRLIEVPHSPNGQDPQVEVFTKPLRRSLTECWSRATALHEIDVSRDAAFSTPRQKEGIYIRAVDDPRAACTTIFVDVGGAIEITLRGPA